MWFHGQGIVFDSYHSGQEKQELLLLDNILHQLRWLRHCNLCEIYTSNWYVCPSTVSKQIVNLSCWPGLYLWLFLNFSPCKAYLFCNFLGQLWFSSLHLGGWKVKIKKFLKPQRCCRNTAVAAMVQNSGLFSRSVPSDLSDMGQHLKSIPQGSMLGHVAATRLEHLLGLAVLQFLILPTPRCKDLKRQKHLQPQRVSKRKKVNHYLVGYICWLLSTFSLSSCCTFPHMRWQLALSFLFGTIFRHFSEQLTRTVPTPRYTMAARLRVFLLACCLLKKRSTTVRGQYPFGCQGKLQVPTDQRRSIDGCKNNIFQHPKHFFGRNQHINKLWIPTRKPFKKNTWPKSRKIGNQKNEQNAGAEGYHYSLSTSLIHDFAGVINLAQYSGPVYMGCKRRQFPQL